jgi:hypothetical protein
MTAGARWARLLTTQIKTYSPDRFQRELGNASAASRIRACLRVQQSSWDAGCKVAARCRPALSRDAMIFASRSREQTHAASLRDPKLGLNGVETRTARAARRFCNAPSR